MLVWFGKTKAKWSKNTHAKALTDPRELETSFSIKNINKNSGGI